MNWWRIPGEPFDYPGAIPLGHEPALRVAAHTPLWWFVWSSRWLFPLVVAVCVLLLIRRMRSS